MLDVAMMHLLLAAMACSDGDKGTTPYDDSAGDDSDSTPTNGAEWTITQISDDNIGLQNVIESAPDGSLALLTWDNGGTTKGQCEQGKTPQKRYTLHYAAESGGSWSFEDVDSPAVAYDPTGAGLAWDASGNVLVAYNGGEPTGILCGADDMILATRSGGSWTSSTVEADSGESATGEAASDAGYVVGSYPAIAVDPASGTIATVFKDTHFGSLQHDDQYRADLEYAASSGGGWTKEAADIGEGAGDRSQLVFDDQGRPVAVYSIPVQEEKENRFGLWASRREKDGTWNAVQLHSGSVGSKISLTTAPTGELVVAIYSASDQAVKIRTLTDPDNFTQSSSWTSELVASNRYDEGEYVSLAYTPDGQRALAYRRCKLLTDEGEGCNINDEAVVFALEGTNGFEMEVVKAGDEGACGEWSSMAIDATGKATILFRCTVEDAGSYALRLFTATRML